MGLSHNRLEGVQDIWFGVLRHLSLKGRTFIFKVWDICLKRVRHFS